jgi:hypothetical protein
VTNSIPGTRTVPTSNQGTTDPAFVKSMLAQTRAAVQQPIAALADGITDLRFYRVWVTDGISGFHLYANAPTLSASRAAVGAAESAAPGSGGQSREPALAQELAVEDRACITAAAAKLPSVRALKIERSRVVPQPHTQGQRDSKLYHVTVEIDASVAGQASTYVYNCIRDGQLTVIQPLGMR